MFDHRASIRYAKPLIDLSISKGVIENVYNDIKLFLDVCKQNFDFSLLLKNPIIPLDKKVSILETIFSKIIHPFTLKSFIKIIYNNRDQILENVCKKYIELYNDHKLIQEVTILSAVIIYKSSIEKLEKKLSKITSKNICLNQQIDPNVIGGFILKIDDKMYDASYLTQLKKIKKILLND